MRVGRRACTLISVMTEHGCAAGRTHSADPLELLSVSSAQVGSTGGMVHMPGGSFLMGSDDPESYSADGEGPVRRVRLQPFWMDATAVSNASFLQFVEDTGYLTESEREGWSFVFHLLLPDDFPPT